MGFLGIAALVASWFETRGIAALVEVTIMSRMTDSSNLLGDFMKMNKTYGI